MTCQYSELLLWRNNFMCVTSFLLNFMGNVVTDKLQFRTHQIVTSVINNITLPFYLHPLMDIINWRYGWKALANFSKRVCSIWNHRHNIFLWVVGLFTSYQGVTGLNSTKNFDVFLQHFLKHSTAMIQPVEDVFLLQIYHHSLLEWCQLMLMYCYFCMIWRAASALIHCPLTSCWNNRGQAVVTWLSVKEFVYSFFLMQLFVSPQKYDWANMADCCIYTVIVLFLLFK